MKVSVDWIPTGAGRMEARGGGFVLEVWPNVTSWGWSATAPPGMKGAHGEAVDVRAAQAAAVAHVQGVLYPERKRGVSRGKSGVAGRGLEGAIEGQAERDRVDGRCTLWRVPSPPATGADARCAVVDFWGVLPGGRAVAIEAKEGGGVSFEVARLEEAQAEVLRAVDAMGGVAGLVVELRGRRWWVPWASVAPRVGGGGYLGVDWMGAHGVEIVGADWLAAACQSPRGEAQGRLV